jgi:kynurenine 3-monooxygenase
VAGAIGGRSINLALSVRGIHALREVGVADEILRSAIPMRGRMIHPRAGELAYQPYDKDPDRCINSVSRAGLNMALLSAAERCEKVRIRFDCRCIDADLDAPSATLLDGQTGESFSAGGQVLIGADGAFSAVRGAMQKLDRFDYQQSYLAHGYKELHIPPGPGGEHRLDRDVLHIWPRRAYMMIALPNIDGSFTCTLFWPFEGPGGFAALRTPAGIRACFEREFADAVPHMPTLVEDYQANPVGSLVTIRCGPWGHRDRVVLLGDAAHAVVPFYGQGMNAAFEGCSALAACLASIPDRAAAFEAYYRERKENADALADLAIGNFLEMRDHAGKASFRMKKSLERTMHRLLPGWFTPLYTMVSFTRIPYAQAVRRAGRQNRMLAASAVVLLVALATAMSVWVSISK